MATTQCGMRACARQLATVVTVDGDIDATNVQQVTQYATRYVLAEKPFVLDLSAVNSISPQGISLIFALDDKCDAAGLEWELVANPTILDSIGHDVDLLHTAGIGFRGAGSCPLRRRDPPAQEASARVAKVRLDHEVRDVPWRHVQH